LEAHIKGNFGAKEKNRNKRKQNETKHTTKERKKYRYFKNALTSNYILVSRIHDTSNLQAMGINRGNKKIATLACFQLNLFLLSDVSKIQTRRLFMLNPDTLRMQASSV